MATIIEPTGFEQEERLQVPVSGVHCLVVSGYANFLFTVSNNVGGPTPSDDAPKGDPDDDSRWLAYDVRMVVGPRWRGVRDVSPSVHLAGWSFANSDEVDDSGFHIDTCTWDTVGMPEPDTELERIRLLVKLRVRGGTDFGVTKLGYQLVANGVLG